MPTFDPSRLYTALLNTGLQTKDNPLYQVIHDLISITTGVNKQVNTFSSGIITPIIGPQGPSGPAGMDGDDFDSFISAIGNPQIGNISTLFTQGSVIFAGPSGFLSQNNSKFFWDNTNFALKLLSAGSAAIPTLQFPGLAGLYSPSANVINISLGNVFSNIQFDGTGNNYVLAARVLGIGGVLEAGTGNNALVYIASSGDGLTLGSAISSNATKDLGLTTSPIRTVFISSGSAAAPSLRFPGTAGFFSTSGNNITASMAGVSDAAGFDATGTNFQIFSNVYAVGGTGDAAAVYISSTTNALLLGTPSSANNTKDIGAIANPIRSIYIGTKIQKYQNIATIGWGIPAIYGIDNRTGLTTADGAATILYTTVATNNIFRVSTDIFATAAVTGTATYTITWTENGTTQTMSVTATAINTLGTQSNIIRPDNATNITSQLTGVFTGTFTIVGLVEQVA